MIRDKEPISVLTAIIIAVASLCCFVFVVVNRRLQDLQAEVEANTASPVDISGWQTYTNSQYGFALEYPPEWEMITDGLGNETPFIALGNPLEGTSTYTMDIFIEENTSSLSSIGYAHALIEAARAVDAANAKQGPAPRTAPQFDKAYVLTVGSYPAYELMDVFEFDHLAERVYVAHGAETLRFDFPVAQENPNISLPVANNRVAHEIMDTLTFTNESTN